jgi:HAD superfamily phosphatase
MCGRKLVTGIELQAIIIFDIDGVVRDVSGSYRRAIADTVEYFTGGATRPGAAAIDTLKAEGIWNNDWEASQELVYRYFEAQGQRRSEINLDYSTLVDFFETKYLGTDPENPTGYICQEPVLVSLAYLDSLTRAGIGWGFFSGAPQSSARFVLERRLGLNFTPTEGKRSPVLVAMEDAPGKPDPTGLLKAVQQIERQWQHPSGFPVPVFYLGDTVADMQTVQQARRQAPARSWYGIGVLPPHVQTSDDSAGLAVHRLNQAGASMVVSHVEQCTPSTLLPLL